MLSGIALNCVLALHVSVLYRQIHEEAYTQRLCKRSYGKRPELEGERHVRCLPDLPLRRVVVVSHPAPRKRYELIIVSRITQWYDLENLELCYCLQSAQCHDVPRLSSEPVISSSYPLRE